MPIHDWTRVGAWAYEDFQFSWLVSIRDTLNRGILPCGYCARLEAFRQRVAIWQTNGNRLMMWISLAPSVDRKRSSAGRVLVRQLTQAIGAGIHVLMIDPFPVTKRTSNGLHNLIWQELGGEAFAQPPGQPLTLAAYEAANPAARCYVEAVGVGEPLPDMPLFLEEDMSIDLPLEATYLTAWAEVLPQDRALLEPPAAVS